MQLTLWLVCLLGFIAQSLAQEPCRDNRRIVGGEKTDIKDHPWQVLLNVSGQVCGGSIVADRWVLTAAHCFFSLSGDRDFSKDTKNARAKTNVTDREFGTWTQIERIVVHKQYAPTARTYEYDLALVKLRFSPAGEVVPLVAPEQQIQPCDLLEVTGWGQRSRRWTAVQFAAQGNCPLCRKLGLQQRACLQWDDQTHHDMRGLSAREYRILVEETVADHLYTEGSTAQCLLAW